MSLPRPNDPLSLQSDTRDEIPSVAADQRGLALLAVSFGFFLVVLDTTALNLALPDMQKELGGTVSESQWVMNSYLIVFASLMLAGGTLADRIGAKRSYQWGLLLFTVSSVLCALATDVLGLISSRALQGLGAAAMLPASLSLLAHTFPRRKERSRAVAKWASVVTLAFAGGPFIGGVLTSLLGWRSVFWLNVPAGIVALIIVQACVPAAAVRDRPGFPYAGHLLALSILSVLSYALIEAGRLGWRHAAVIIALILALVLVTAFTVLERRAPTPVLPAGLFRNAQFAVPVATGFVLNFGVYGVLFVQSLYFQDKQGLGPILTGLSMLPLTLTPAVVTRLPNYAPGQWPVRKMLLAGTLSSTAGVLLLAYGVHSSTYVWMLWGLFLLGCGLAVLMPGITTAVLRAAPVHLSGIASGVLNTSRQVGGLVGVAIMGGLFQGAKTEGLIVSFILAGLGFLLIVGTTHFLIKG